MSNDLPRLHFITRDVHGIDHPKLAREACKGYIDLVQLRIKNKGFREIKALAEKTFEIADMYNAKLIINDQVDLAVEIGAHGVHLGKHDMHPLKARKILGDEVIIGGTADSFEMIKELHGIVDYIGLGPFRFTQTKSDLSPVLGLQGYKTILQQCRKEKIDIPIIGVGGIKINDIEPIMQAGLYGVAVSSALAQSDYIAFLAEDFINEVNRVTQKMYH